MKQLAPTEWFFMAVYTWMFYYDLSEASFDYIQTKRMDTLHEDLNTFFQVYLTLPPDAMMRATGVFVGTNHGDPIY